MKILKLVFALLPFLFLSCAGNLENNKKIVGAWVGSEWLVNGMPSDMKAEETIFTFNDKEEYTYESTGVKETGTYKVENDLLFTKATGKLEIMVKIARLTADTLVFDMNRGGRPEMLTLLRKK